MRILNAWIDDPTLHGELEAPRLCVEVDEKPTVSIKPEPFAGGWQVSKYGPFVKYFCSTERVGAGDFNIRFRNRFPVVIDIQLYVGDGDEEGTSEFCLPLTRARQLTRKHDDGWRLLVSDKAAEKGELLWVPVETDPSCRHWLGHANGTCKQRPARAVRHHDINFPLCAEHLQQHNSRQATARAEFRTS
jgi:hypothetical protein